MNLADFHETVRSVLGDHTTQVGLQEYSDDQLNAAIRTMMKVGQGPKEINVDPNDNEALIPEPNADQFGYISLKTAILLLGGMEVLSYRTRAQSVTRFPADKKFRINLIISWITDLEEGGNLGEGMPTAGAFFDTSSDCLTTFRDVFTTS
jgi:hypothetical protein